MTVEANGTGSDKDHKSHRFVILEHDHPFLHWDLMLESGNVLRCWRLLEEPRINVRIGAEELGNHRLLYLDYEGPVSGNRGQVRRWDVGTYLLHSNSSKRVGFLMFGEKLTGAVRLELVHEFVWSFLCMEDEEDDEDEDDEDEWDDLEDWDE